MFVIKTKKPVVALLRQDNGLQTTDNGGYAGTTDSRNYGNWLRFATPDNGQRRAKPAQSSWLIAFLYYTFYTFYTL